MHLTAFLWTVPIQETWYLVLATSVPKGASILICGCGSDMAHCMKFCSLDNILVQFGYWILSVTSEKCQAMFVKLSVASGTHRVAGSFLETAWILLVSGFCDPPVLGFQPTTLRG